jgi:transposase-like protein
MSGLPGKKHQAIAALLTHRTVGEAAQAIGVGESTLFRWFQNQDFQRAYREAKAQVVQQAITKLQQTSGEAVETLQGIMNNQEAPPSTRVTAARIILEMSVKAVELEDLASRVEALEGLIKVKG